MSPEETSEYMIKLVGTDLKILIPYENWAIVNYYDMAQIRHLCNNIGDYGYPTIHLPYGHCDHTPPDGLISTYYLLREKIEND